MKPTTIYVLRDPRDGRVRYVGKTVAKLNERLSAHMSDSRTKKSHRGRWIASLVKEELRPIIEPIEVTGEDWADRERFWIAHYRAIVADLTNECDGGEGVAGIVRSPEQRAQLAAAARAASKSKEWKERMVASRPDFWTPARRAAQATITRACMTPERRAAHAQKLKKITSAPEWLAAHSICEKSKWTPQMRATQAERTRMQLAAKRMQEAR